MRHIFDRIDAEFNIDCRIVRVHDECLVRVDICVVTRSDVVPHLMGECICLSDGIVSIRYPIDTVRVVLVLLVFARDGKIRTTDRIQLRTYQKLSCVTSDACFIGIPIRPEHLQ